MPCFIYDSCKNFDLYANHDKDRISNEYTELGGLTASLSSFALFFNGRRHLFLVV